jgi:hypothetical protein
MVIVAERRTRANLSTANHVDATPGLADDPTAMLPSGLAQQDHLVDGRAVTILWHV